MYFYNIQPISNFFFFFFPLEPASLVSCPYATPFLIAILTGENLLVKTLWQLIGEKVAVFSISTSH